MKQSKDRYVRRVGIVTMPAGPIRREKDISFITNNNAKWFLERGIEVVPIPFLTTRPEHYFNQIHGIYLQGGPDYDPRYVRLVTKLLTLAIRANERGTHFPVWGTCHGFQVMCMILGRLDALDTFNSLHDYWTNIHLQRGAMKARMFANFTSEEIDYLQRDNNVFFTHQYGITPYDFSHNSALNSVFRIIGTTRDRDNKSYVSLIEGRELPFYGSQFHPEAVPSLEPIRAFFIGELMKNRGVRRERGMAKTFRRTHITTKCATRKNKEYYKVFDNSECYFFRAKN